MIEAMPSKPTPPEVTILAIYRRENGMFVVADALQRTHYASDAPGLGAVVEQLLEDPELPHSRVTEQNDSVDLATGIAKKIVGRFAPEHTGLIEAIEPGAHAIMNTLERTRSTRARRPRKNGRVRG